MMAEDPREIDNLGNGDVDDDSSININFLIKFSFFDDRKSL